MSTASMSSAKLSPIHNLNLDRQKWFIYFLLDIEIKGKFLNEIQGVSHQCMPS